MRVAAATLAEDRGSERRVQGLRGDSLLLVAVDAPERERLAECGLLGRGLALVLVQQPLLVLPIAPGAFPAATSGLPRG